jgi:hypothetical protein
MYRRLFEICRVNRDRSSIPVAIPISGAKQNTQTTFFFSDTRTGILSSIAGPCDFLPARSDKFQKVCGTYHHKLCKFESRSGKVYSIQHYVIKFISNLQQVGGFLRILRFPPPKKLGRLLFLFEHRYPITIQNWQSNIRDSWTIGEYRRTG